MLPKKAAAQSAKVDNEKDAKQAFEEAMEIFFLKQIPKELWNVTF